MEADLAKKHPELGVSLLAINEAGHEDGLPDVAKTADLPCLQDTAKDDVWGSWGAEWRDVYVLNADNEVTAVYNLTIFSLSDPENYAELEALLIDAGK
jgi:hypothetical protein